MQNVRARSACKTCECVGRAEREDRAERKLSFVCPAEPMPLKVKNVKLIQNLMNSADDTKHLMTVSRGASH